jgi:hypothetical protein
MDGALFEGGIGRPASSFILHRSIGNFHLSRIGKSPFAFVCLLLKTRAAKKGRSRSFRRIDH